MAEENLNRQKSQEILASIQYHAAIIHDLLQPGSTVDITFMDNNQIISPMPPRVVGRLIITRPTAVLQIKTR